MELNLIKDKPSIKGWYWVKRTGLHLYIFYFEEYESGVKPTASILFVDDNTLCAGPIPEPPIPS